MSKSRDRRSPPPSHVAHEPPASGAPPTDTVITVALTPQTLVTVAGVVLVAFLAYLWGTGRVAVPEVDASSSLLLIFLTGLTVGGLSCLAVQGGLLAMTIAQRELRLHRSEGQGVDHLLPTVQFLGAKITAYTVLGALLGYFGSIIPLGVQGWLQVAAGVFMIVVVLQMFDAHPFFRRFAFQPPKAVQRLLRRESKRGGALGPALLGTLTVFIPCGVTLAMEALAIASNSPVRGALVMFAFTAGTAPLFLLLGFLASGVGRTAYGVFRPIAATTLVVVAGISIVTGMRLLGFGGFGGSGAAVPARLIGPGPATGAVGLVAGPGSWSAPAPVPNLPAAASGPQVSQVAQEATINVVPGAYEPARLQIKAGLPTRLNLVSQNAYGCIRAFNIPSLGIQKVLPETGTEAIELPALPAGDVDFMCSMGMYGGVIEVVE